MTKVLSRPVLLVPIGVGLVLVALLVALNAIGAWRWGGVVASGRACGSGEDGLCLVREDVALDGPRYSRRSAGEDWVLQPASGETEEVALPDGDSEALGDAGTSEAVMLSQPDGDVVGVEAGGRAVGTTWVGAYGVLQLVGLGLVLGGLGVGTALSGRRMRRASGSWTATGSVREHGVALVALPVVAGGVLWMLPRFIW